MKFLLCLLLLLLTLDNAIAQWNPGDVITDERDGQTYKTVKIGNQIWMAENLNIGTIIPSTSPGYEMSNNDVIEKYCWDNEAGNCDGSDGTMKRGGFYEWKEAMQFWDGQPELPVKGICPKGWHIPANSEWNELFANTGGDNAFTNLLQGGNSGFDAFLTGYRCTMTGAFRISAMSEDVRTYYWTSEQSDNENAPLMEIGQGSLVSFAFQKSLGLCIRCIMDDPSTSVDETSNELELNIYPNPSSENISISFSKSELSNLSISIFNSMGEEVKYFDTKELSGKSSINFSSEDLPAGVYYCTLDIGNNKNTKSFVLVR